MNLFPAEVPVGHPLPLSESVQPPPCVNTPLGVVATDFIVHDAALEMERPDERMELPSGATLTHFHRAGVDCELLRVELGPVLPAGLHVDGCVALLWRVSPRRRTGPWIAQARWLPGYRWLTGAPEPGEGFDAQTWTDGQAAVSVGTEAGDALAFRALRGAAIPFRWLDDLFAQGQRRVAWDDESLWVPLPSLEAGELCQIQFVVSWCATPGQGVSTWLAVDQPPRRILRAAGCEG